MRKLLIGLLFAAAMSAQIVGNSQSGGGGASGSGTPPFLPVWATGSTLGNSSLQDDGSTITLGEPVLFNASGQTTWTLYNSGGTATTPTAGQVAVCGTPSGTACPVAWATVSGVPSGTSAQFIVYNGSNVAAAVAMSGVIAITNAGVSSFASSTGSGAVVLAASPALTGSPTAPTQSAADNSTKIATTAYADRAGTPSGTSGQIIVYNGSNAATATTVSGVVGIDNTGATTFPSSTGSGAVVLAVSGALTGNPTAPTQSANNNSTRLATTAYADRAATHVVTFVFDGGTSSPTAGASNKFPTAPSGGTINAVYISADASCSATVDIWKRAGAIPTSGNKISASAPATLSSAQLNQGGSVGTWTTAVASGDVFGASLATISGCLSVMVQVVWQ